MSGRMALLWNAVAQQASRLNSGALATSGEYAVDEICGDERRVRRGKECK